MNKYIIILISVFVFSSTVYSIDDKLKDCFPKAQATTLRVYDLSDVLDASQEKKLNQKLGFFSDQTSNQIVVVITDDLCGVQPSQYATELGHHWGVGQDKFDNGIVILLSPELHETFIAIGYGLEGAIPDITANHIVKREMIPHFKVNDWYGGLDSATNTIIALAKGEYNSDEYNGSSNEETTVAQVVMILLFIGGIFTLIFLLWYKATKDYAKINNIGFWAAYALMSAARRKHSGSYNNFHSGGWRGGGGSGFGGGGGGFGGFGGGGFGGGGAGGSW